MLDAEGKMEFMKIGVLNGLRNGGRCFDRVQQFGLDVCQLSVWAGPEATPEVADVVREESARTGVRICAVWGGWPGKAEWNFTGGPTTLGIVPREMRRERLDALKHEADFAQRCGAPALITHVGFIPENITDPMFDEVVEAIREIAVHCDQLGLGFWFETGQETPVTLLRTIKRVGTGNMGINLDPANLILYGKGNPVDALDVFGQYVTNIHVKDGMYPTDPDKLGEEVKPGLGKVNFPVFVKRLKEIGFDGDWIIEREIPEGDEQTRDIRETVENLKIWWNA